MEYRQKWIRIINQGKAQFYKDLKKGKRNTPFAITSGMCRVYFGSDNDNYILKAVIDKIKLKTCFYTRRNYTKNYSVLKIMVFRNSNTKMLTTITTITKCEEGAGSGKTRIMENTIKQAIKL